MAQTYTLDEAADKLNLSIEEFKRRLRTEWTQVRSFRDGTTLRFRANEIDELARSIGLGSSEELPLANDAPLDFGDPDDMVLLSNDDPGPSPSGRFPRPAKSDSDVRLEKAGRKKPADADDEESILTEEVELPSAGGSGKLSGKSGKLSASKLRGDSGKLKGGDSGKMKSPPKADDSSSEFELSLEPDSDEFELSLANDSSEEVALGDLPADKNKGGRSGINLNRPADSGVSLEKKKKPSDDDEIDFELSLETPGSGASSKKLGKNKVEADSDSEFELTLEEPSDLAADSGKGKKGDIFEATDFEIPALEDDSASEAVALDDADTDLESSDFDLALDDADAAADDESASEVVSLDDDEVDARRKKAKKKARRAADDDDEGEVDLGDIEDEGGGSASAALRGVRRGDDDEDEEYEVSEAAEGTTVVAAPAKWGPLPVVLMAPTALIMFIGGIMAYELLHSAWGAQQQTKPTTPLVSWMAETMGEKPSQ